MPPFSPDSSVVERVEPSPNFDERTGLARPDMIILHYTGMQFSHEAIHRLCDPKARVSCALRGAGNRLDHSARAGEQARLACRRVGLGRRHRHQLALDRHRGLQSRPRFRLSGFSVTADRRDDHAVPLDPDPQHHPAGKCRWRIPTWRRAASRIRARNFPGSFLPNPASVSGPSRSGRRRPNRSRPTTPARRSPSCRRLLAEYGYGIDGLGPLRRRHHGGRHRLPAPLPAGAGRRHRRRHDAADVAEAAGRPRLPAAEAGLPAAEACAGRAKEGFDQILLAQAALACLLTATAARPIPIAVSRLDGRSGNHRKVAGEESPGSRTNGAG